jgi:hypothetical protein
MRKITKTKKGDNFKSRIKGEKITKAGKIAGKIKPVS